MTRPSTHRLLRISGGHASLLITLLLLAGCPGPGGGGRPMPRTDGGGGCAYDFECRAPTPRCDTGTQRCAACLPQNDNCPAGQHCTDLNGTWQCSVTCTSAADCARVDGGAALDCCGGVCVDTTADGKNCGACGRACAPPANATAACANGACVIGACSAGFTDCDRSATNGCEVQTATDPANCGACGVGCSLANANAGCAMGACSITSCRQGFSDCNRGAQDGCEARTSSDSANCGSCGNACPTLPNGTAVCTGGVCSLGPCAQGFADCDRVTNNGCEVPTQSDARNCGSCAFVCSLPNATANCNGGQCAVAACTNGFGDCDRFAGNGCEANVNADPRHCGSCGRSCPVLANASSSCAGGVCGLGSCVPGFASCDGSPNNGCEANINTSTSHCGACNRPCQGNDVCSGGVCLAPNSRVLIAGAPATSSWLMDVQAKLQATGVFSQVDTMNVSTTTPTLQQLQAYSAVLVFSDTSFSDPTTLGDNLAAYYDGGGQVVVTTFANASVPIGGRFGDVANGYALIGSGSQESPAASLGTIREPTSPLMAGVTVFSATAAFRSTGGAVNGGVVVAEWSDGQPLVVRGVVKGRNRVDLNFYPPSSAVRADFWTGDGALLMKNALLYR